jgi:hypothetical protein
VEMKIWEIEDILINKYNIFYDTGTNNVIT